MSDVSARKMIGESAGLTLRKLGGSDRSGGRRRIADEIADCTSSAAASIERARSNSSVIEVTPSTLVDVMELTPAMVVKLRSSGAATETAMVDGLAPGRRAVTAIVGTSMRGIAAIGNWR